MKNLFKDIAVVIPVREGSSRIKSKVLLPFTKKYNLTEWKIVQLKKFLDPQQIYVSTNSDKLKSIAKKYDVMIHDREDYFCDGHKATFSDVIFHIVKDVPFKHIAWITVVAPLMSPTDYQNAFKTYMKQIVELKNNDSLVSVNLLKEYLWDKGGALNYEANKHHTVSQDLPNIYRVSNGLYLRDKNSILKDKYFLGESPFMFEVSKIAGIDIDVIEDYEIARELLKLYKDEL